MNGCPSRSTPPKATWRRSSTLTARRAPDVTAAPTLRAQLPYLYLRKMPDRTIVWTSPTGRVYRTRPDGYDLFPQLRPACRAPTARRRSHSHDKRIAHAAAGFAINARSTPKPGVSTAHAHKKSPTATGATTCAKCSSCSKAPNRAPALVHLGQRPIRTRTTATRLETTTHHHTNSTTSHPSDALQSSAGRPTPSSAPFPGWSSSRCRAPNRETRTT